jgi:hypothetical protein
VLRKKSTHIERCNFPKHPADVNCHLNQVVGSSMTLAAKNCVLRDCVDRVTICCKCILNNAAVSEMCFARTLA